MTEQGVVAERAWPIAGRTEELAFVGSALRRHGGVVLAGAAGVGKTRLAREAVRGPARGLPPRWVPARWVTATAAARAVPLGAFTPVTGRSTTLHDAVGEFGRDGRLLVVDDAHLLDDVSAALLHQTVLTRAAAVLVTLRSGEPVPDAVRALWKDERLPRLEVQPLSEPETAELVETVLGGPVDGECRRRLWGLSGGNVLYLRQIVDGARLRPVHGVWCWDAGTCVGPALADLVDARIGRLSDDERHVLEIVALGEPIGVALLETLVDRAALDRVERRELVTVGVDGMRVEARLAHPLYGEVLRARISTLRARRLRGALATAIAGTGARRGDDTLRRAVLVVDSDLDPDPVLLATAARHAAARHDLPLAQRLGRASWERGPRFGPGLLLAYVLSWLGRATEAEPVLDGLAHLAADDDQRAQVTALRVANLFFPGRRPDRAVEMLDGAGPAAELRGLRATLDAHRGRLPEAVAAGRAVLSEPDAGPHARSWAAFGLCHALGRAGRLAEAGAAAAGVRPGGSVNPLQIAHAEVTAECLAGALDRAAERAGVHDVLARSGTGPAGPMACLLAAQVDLARGRLDPAVRLLREARVGAFVLYANLLLPTALGMLGDAPAARAAQQEAEAARHPGITLVEPDLLLGRAWVAAAEGVTSEAIGHARRAAATAAAGGQHAVEVHALHTAVCLGDRTADARLGALRAVVEGPRVEVAADHAAALTAGDPVALDGVSRAAEAMGALLVAADAAAHASVCHDRAGSPRPAAAAAARARDLARRCGGATTPALRALASTSPLTGREREVVALAATGLSNQDIARRLVVSVRTVEGHLYRAFAKLGVTDRGGLRPA